MIFIADAAFSCHHTLIDVVLNESDKNTIRDLEGIDVDFASESLHPGLDRNAAGQTGVAFEVRH
jgi:hypothetical protein